MTCIMWWELKNKSNLPGNHNSGILTTPMNPPTTETTS
jgi:hypothetical protein